MWFYILIKLLFKKKNPMASNYPKTKIQAVKQTFVSRPVTSLHHTPRSPDFSSVELCMFSQAQRAIISALPLVLCFLSYT